MQRSDLSRIDRLLEELQNNLTDAKLSLDRQQQLLSEIKTASRQPTTAQPLFTEKSISLLSIYGLRRESTLGSNEALRCLANTLVLNEPSRRVFIDLGHTSDVATRYRECTIDEEFLCARILLLLTYNTTLDYEALIEQHGISRSITAHLDNHARSLTSTPCPSDQRTMAMSETLRLLFNIQHFYPQSQKHFVALPGLGAILLKIQLPEPPLQSTICSIINALLSLDLQAAITTTTSSSNAQVETAAIVTRLISVLEEAILQHSEQDLEQNAAPLCTLLRRIYELGDGKIQSLMRGLLLPSQQDRKQPLGSGDSFSARLLRLTTSPHLPTLRENISNLLYELSDGDPDKFVHNIGYGYASGFLMSHNIAVPVESNDSVDASASSTAINPITGQAINSESEQDLSMPEMTDEEKEREAERLFVLFERLKATGVVDVKNPVEQYYNQHGQ